MNINMFKLSGNRHVLFLLAIRPAVEVTRFDGTEVAGTVKNRRATLLSRG